MWVRNFLEQRPGSVGPNPWELMAAFETFAPSEDTWVCLLTTHQKSCVWLSTDEAKLQVARSGETTAPPPHTHTPWKCQLGILAFKLEKGHESAGEKYKYWEVGRSQAVIMWDLKGLMWQFQAGEITLHDVGWSNSSLWSHYGRCTDWRDPRAEVGTLPGQ